MPNHIHLIWEVLEGFKLADVQRDFLKFTSQQIKFDLQKNHPMVLEKFKVNLRDRKYRFWQDRSLSVQLYNDKIFMQKLHYIHENPVQEHWKLTSTPETYPYSSAGFYYTGRGRYDFITHYDV